MQQQLFYFIILQQVFVKFNRKTAKTNTMRIFKNILRKSIMIFKTKRNNNTYAYTHVFLLKLADNILKYCYIDNNFTFVSHETPINLLLTLLLMKKSKCYLK